MAADVGLGDGLKALLVPLSLTLRALDDLTAAAEVARRSRREEEFDDLRESLGTLAGTAEPIQGAAESIARVAERVPGGKRKQSE